MESVKTIIITGSIRASNNLLELGAK